MSVDPKTPVIVGVGQVNQRLTGASEVATAREPVALIAEALQLAEADAGARGSLLQAADSVRVVAIGSWRYRDPGSLVARLVGAMPRQTVLTAVGGNSAQMLVNRTALDIQRGDVRVTLIGGAEALASRFAARRHGVRLDWTTQPDDEGPDLVLGDPRPGVSDAEQARGIAQPIEVYPIIEQALRGHLGRSLDQHLDVIAGLWSRFSAVAATNPQAWSHEVFSPAAIREPSTDNRLVGLPYTKRMCANMHVDQAAGLIMCSAEAADEAGIPRERWVFPWSGTDVADHWHLSERDLLHASPAIAAGGHGALRLAGLDVDDLAFIDLYSCFPVAVEIAARELGLSLDRELTVTGGLAFAGGPLSNYVTHSIATMVQRLRAAPDSVGLVSGLGWFFTKHAFGVYGGRPPAGGYRHATPQAEVDRLPRREPEPGYAGPATLEGYTVMHDRDGTATKALAAVRTPRGARTWASATEPGIVKAAVVDDLLGDPIVVRPDGTFTPA